MIRNILAVIAGFILWSVLWVGSDAVLTALSPDWYGEGTKNFNSSFLLVAIVRSIIISLVAGYVAALIARQDGLKAVLALGVLLLAFGVFVQAQVWNAIPLWYHLIFLVLLIPASWLGGRLRFNALKS